MLNFGLSPDYPPKTSNPIPKKIPYICTVKPIFSLTIFKIKNYGKK